MAKMRTNSFGGTSVHGENGGIKRSASEGDVGNVIYNMYQLKASVLNRKRGIEERLKRLGEQNEQLKKLKESVEAVNDAQKRIEELKIISQEKELNEEQKNEMKKLEETEKGENRDVKDMLNTMLAQNGTRFGIEELNLINNIKESRDIEYTISTIDGMLKVKKEEIKFNEDYLNQYKNLYDDINKVVSNNISNDEKKELIGKFEMIKLYEDNLNDIVRSKEQFSTICKSGKIDGKFYEEYSYSDGTGRIRKNNFTQLYNDAVPFQNKYLKLLVDIVKYGKEQETEFEKYLEKNREAIRDDINKSIEYFEGLNLEVKKLKAKVSSMKVENIDDLKEVINEFNQVKSVLGAGKIDYDKFKKEHVILQQIDERQNMLDRVQSCANIIVRKINGVIDNNMEEIKARIHYGHQFNSSYKYEKIGKTIKENLQVVETSKDSVSLKKRFVKIGESLKGRLIKIKGSLEKAQKWIKSLLQGKITIRRTLGELKIQAILKEVEKAARKPARNMILNIERENSGHRGIERN